MCGTWTSSISITWELVINAHSQAAQPRPIKSEILQVRPSRLGFKKPFRWVWCSSVFERTMFALAHCVPFLLRFLRREHNEQGARFFLLPYFTHNSSAFVCKHRLWRRTSYVSFLAWPAVSHWQLRCASVSLSIKLGWVTIISYWVVRIKRGNTLKYLEWCFEPSIK